MSMLGAKKKRAQRAFEKDFRQSVEYWLLNGHSVNHLIIPPEREIPRYLVERIVCEERAKHDAKHSPEQEVARLSERYRLHGYR